MIEGIVCTSSHLEYESTTTNSIDPFTGPAKSICNCSMVDLAIPTDGAEQELVNVDLLDSFDKT